MEWVILIVYGLVLWYVSPLSPTREVFYGGESKSGNEAGFLVLTGSVFISWVFAKSITNAANLGASYGFTGGLAYAAWYGSVPVAGIVIYLLRRRFGVSSLVEFLLTKYGQWATGAFMVAIFIRLFNEIWSNTMVVGTYFGDKGSTSYYLACLLFTGITLAYSLRGGLRSSLVTDAIQVVMMVFFVVLVMGFLVPKRGTQLVSAGEFTMNGGIDLLLVGLLQSLSYPFHDPVLTDRGFITQPATMLKSFLVAGLCGAAIIVLFSLVGVHAYLGGMSIQDDAPPQVAASLGVTAFLMMNVIMLTSAGSTIDSTFSSLAREIGLDLADFTGWFEPGNISVGRWVMVVMALVGNLPLLTGATILQATTISGTMVMGLAPVFLLFWWERPGSLSFHLSFWLGLVLGTWEVLGTIPAFMTLGNGSYAALLGVNLYGLMGCFLLYAVGAFLRPSPSHPTR